jgi:pimeloyl-ACP methyl ester carboxylesterase
VCIFVAKDAQGAELFAHGSGSSRVSPRNREVAEELQRAGLATFLVDLLTWDEAHVDARTGRFRFDIGLLAHRVVALTHGLAGFERTVALDIGLVDASTVAAAALVAAAARPEPIRVVVSRGGRPDLAGDAICRVHQPTLLIVGELDEGVLALNREAMAQLAGEARLEIVPGASRLFEEPGALEWVAALAREWITCHLRRTAL